MIKSSYDPMIHERFKLKNVMRELTCNAIPLTS